LAQQSGAALRLTRELIAQKLAGQEQVVRNKLLDSMTADAIARFRAEVATAESLATIRLLESQGAAAYWSAWRTLPINFPNNDGRRVPDHWRTFGARISPISGSPRLAANPPNAILNYCYTLLESEARINSTDEVSRTCSRSGNSDLIAIREGHRWESYLNYGANGRLS